jgi:hypothetical protein
MKLAGLPKNRCIAISLIAIDLGFAEIDVLQPLRSLDTTDAAETPLAAHRRAPRHNQLGRFAADIACTEIGVVTSMTSVTCGLTCSISPGFRSGA